MLLSSKHLLQTSSQKVEWPTEMLGKIVVERHMLIPNSGGGSNPMSLIIDLEDVSENEAGQNVLTRFGIKNKKSDTEWIDSPVELIMSERTMRLVDAAGASAGEVSIPFKEYGKTKRNAMPGSMDEDSSDSSADGEDNPNVSPAAFYTVTENREISASLKGVQDLIETREHLGIEDYGGIYNRMLSLLNESGIGIAAVHIEMILRALVRDPEDNSARPDFSQPDHPEYTVMRVADAIMASKSVSVSLAFEKLSQQLKSPDTFKKMGTSALDRVFMN
jgi:hypothetical protein